MKTRTIKKNRYQEWLASRSNPPLPQFTTEELAWLNVRPVGREFGSADYDRLMAEDAAKVQR